MELIAQIALGVIIGGLTIALVVIGFFVWNSRQRNERLAVGLFIAGAVIVVVLVVVVARTYLKIAGRSRSAINIG
jgi:uncharacterized SAM-binding protein YcdF (DUF218 family)